MHAQCKSRKSATLKDNGRRQALDQHANVLSALLDARKKDWELRSRKRATLKDLSDGRFMLKWSQQSMQHLLIGCHSHNLMPHTR